MASSKLNLHGGFFWKNGHLSLFESKHTCVIHRSLDTISFVSGLNAWIVVFGVEHEEYLVAVEDLTSDVGAIPTRLAAYFLV